MAKADYRAALYMRLSKDDDGAAESASITTQRSTDTPYMMNIRTTVTPA